MVVAEAGLGTLAGAGLVVGYGMARAGLAASHASPNSIGYPVTHEGGYSRIEAQRIHDMYMSQPKPPGPDPAASPTTTEEATVTNAQTANQESPPPEPRLTNNQRKAKQAEEAKQRKKDVTEGRVPKRDLKPSEKKKRTNREQTKSTDVQDLIDKEQSIRDSNAENSTSKIGSRIDRAASDTAQGEEIE